MPAPRLGYLCLSENPTAEAGRALIRQFVLVREADRMGYDDIWLAEQHDEPAWPNSAVVALLGHLAAASSKARIGALPLLPALREPLPLAEDLATLDLLSKGRLELGVASGAAFPAMLAARGLTPDAARQRLREVMTRLPALQAAAQPQPAQQPLPVWLAADDEASLRLAAEQGWGLAAAATHSRERIARACRLYRDASGGRAPPLLLARFGCSADSRDEARATARPYFEALAVRAQAAGWGADRHRSIARDVEALLAESLIGRHDEVAAQFRALGDELGAGRIAVAPTSGQFDTHKHILAAFVDEVRPLFDE